MSKHIAPDFFYDLPSKNKVHPYRLILKDGCFMWKHALVLGNSHTFLPETEAHEQHIIKTAQRLEELNSWVSSGLQPWEGFEIAAWYVPIDPELSEGISVFFSHATHDIDYTYKHLLPHVQDHERLELRNSLLFFKRC